MQTGGLLLAAGGAVSLVVALVTRTRPLDQYSFEGLFASASFAAVCGTVIVVAGWRRTPSWVLAAFPGLAIVLVSAGIHWAGPDLPLGGVFYLWLVIWASMYVSRRIALAVFVAAAVAYGVVLAPQEMTVPAAVWMFTMATAAMSGLVVGSLVHRADELAEAEHGARLEIESAHAELSEWNRTLEERVASQVAAVEGLNRLRRFLPAPVVDAVLSGDRQDLLEPHRRQIAVLFCDLRGFTAFTAAAQPEEVDAVLRSYFDVLGEHVSRYRATVGGFTGDGLMAFFNDPLPVEQPAVDALHMAVDVRAAMAPVVHGWRAQGFDLGLGMGVALGFANIGMIGFEGRRDYTALGPVVNLAARLCAEARDDEILIDVRARAAAAHVIVDTQERQLQLKGYQQPVVACVVRSVSPLA